MSVQLIMLKRKILLYNLSSDLSFDDFFNVLNSS